MNEVQTLYGLMHIIEKQQEDLERQKQNIDKLLDQARQQQDNANRQMRSFEKIQEQTQVQLKKSSDAALNAIDQHAKSVQTSLMQNNKEAIEFILNSSVEEHQKQLQKSIEPAQNAMDGWQQQLAENTEDLRHIARYFFRKNLKLAIAVAVGVSSVIVISTWIAVGHERQQLKAIESNKQAWQQEVARLQNQAQDWEKRAGKAQLSQCGEAKRLCVRVDPRVFYGENNDYVVIKGY